MLFDVYNLGTLESGFEPVDALRAGPQRGELILKPTQHAGDGLDAQLLDPDTGYELLQHLRYAKVIKIGVRGMIVEGRVMVAERSGNKARANQFTIRWLCKHVGAPAVLDTEKLLKRSASRLRAKSMSGFDPADDNYLS